MRKQWCKHGDLRPEDQKQDEAIEISSESDCSDVEAFDFELRLGVLQAANPTFPVHQVFSTLQKKLGLKGQNVKENLKQDSHGQRSCVVVQGATTPSTSSCGLQDSPIATPAKPHRPNRLSRTRRSKRECGKFDITETEPDCQTRRTSAVYQREPSGEDVLWTDKYCPGHSTEVIGNRDAIGQLHSWLKKWKRRTNIEERTKYKEKLNEEQSNDCWDCGDFEDEVGAADQTDEQLCNTVLLTGPLGVGKTAAVYACAMELGYKVFEVNCSSQRSGQEVMSQLKEATQSHLVETSGANALKPAFFNSYNTLSRSSRSATLPGWKRCMHVGTKLRNLKKAATSSISKNRPVQNRSNCKKRVNPITLTSYFKTKAKADYFYHCGTSTNKSTDPAVGADQTQTLNKNMATCLILFEEVDVVFEDDVGFHAAIKTLMTTTKRPVILTTTDPLFRERFNSSLDEILFQTPSMADVCSYLQLVCLVETIQLEFDDVSTLFKVTRGDVRRCLLQLQLWANSGGGRPIANEKELNYKSCSANMLGLQSVTQMGLQQLLHEQRITELLQPMVESWRNGFPILYSNLELCLRVDANECPFSELDKTAHSCPGQSVRSAAKTRSRLSRKKIIPSLTTPSAHTADSLGALSDFFDLMSFIDASLQPVGPCKLVDFEGTGAKLLDGQLDEMTEEEWKSQEIVLDIQSTLEALALCKCKTSSQGDASLKRGPFPALSDTKNLTCHSSPHFVHQRRVLLNKKVLSSRYFSLLHNRRAACIDYLPVIRFICRMHRKRQKQKTEELDWCVKNFRTQLGLAKKTIHLLASEFS